MPSIFTVCADIVVDDVDICTANFNGVVVLVRWLEDVEDNTRRKSSGGRDCLVAYVRRLLGVEDGIEDSPGLVIESKHWWLEVSDLLPVMSSCGVYVWIIHN